MRPSPARRPAPPRRPHKAKYPDLGAYFAQSGVTQVTVAARTGITQAQLSRIINGLTVPRPALAARLATYCSVPLGSFYRVYLLARARRVA